MCDVANVDTILQKSYVFRFQEHNNMLWVLHPRTLYEELVVQQTSEVQAKGCRARDPPPYCLALIQSHNAPVKSFPISLVVPSGKLST